jgi:hypothetical protein
MDGFIFVLNISTDGDGDPWPNKQTKKTRAGRGRREETRLLKLLLVYIFSWVSYKCHQCYWGY